MSKRAKENVADIQKIMEQAKKTLEGAQQLRNDIERTRKEIMRDINRIRAKLTSDEITGLMTAIEEAGRLANIGRTEQAKIFLNNALKVLGKLN